MPRTGSVVVDPAGAPPILASEADGVLTVLHSFGWEWSSNSDIIASDAAAASSPPPQFTAMIGLAEALREVLHLPTLQTITEQLSFTEQLSAKNQAGGGGGEPAGGMGDPPEITRQRSSNQRGPPNAVDSRQWVHSSPRFKGVILGQVRDL